MDEYKNTKLTKYFKKTSLKQIFEILKNEEEFNDEELDENLNKNFIKTFVIDFNGNQSELELIKNFRHINNFIYKNDTLLKEFLPKINENIETIDKFLENGKKKKKKMVKYIKLFDIYIYNIKNFYFYVNNNKEEFCSNDNKKKDEFSNFIDQEQFNNTFKKIKKYRKIIFKEEKLFLEKIKPKIKEIIINFSEEIKIKNIKLDSETQNILPNLNSCKLNNQEIKHYKDIQEEIKNKTLESYEIFFIEQREFFKKLLESFGINESVQKILINSNKNFQKNNPLFIINNLSKEKKLIFNDFLKNFKDIQDSLSAQIKNLINNKPENYNNKKIDELSESLKNLNIKDSEFFESLKIINDKLSKDLDEFKKLLINLEQDQNKIQIYEQFFNSDSKIEKIINNKKANIKNNIELIQKSIEKLEENLFENEKKILDNLKDQLNKIKEDEFFIDTNKIKEIKNFSIDFNSFIIKDDLKINKISKEKFNLLLRFKSYKEKILNIAEIFEPLLNKNSEIKNIQNLNNEKKSIEDEINQLIMEDNKNEDLEKKEINELNKKIINITNNKNSYIEELIKIIKIYVNYIQKVSEDTNLKENIVSKVNKEIENIENYQKLNFENDQKLNFEKLNKIIDEFFIKNENNNNEKNKLLNEFFEFFKNNDKPNNNDEIKQIEKIEKIISFTKNNFKNQQTEIQKINNIINKKDSIDSIDTKDTKETYLNLKNYLDIEIKNLKENIILKKKEFLEKKELVSNLNLNYQIFFKKNEEFIEKIIEIQNSEIEKNLLEENFKNNSILIEQLNEQLKKLEIDKNFIYKDIENLKDTTIFQNLKIAVTKKVIEKEIQILGTNNKNLENTNVEINNKINELSESVLKNSLLRNMLYIYFYEEDNEKNNKVKKNFINQFKNLIENNSKNTENEVFSKFNFFKDLNDENTKINNIYENLNKKSINNIEKIDSNIKDSNVSKLNEINKIIEEKKKLIEESDKKLIEEQKNLIKKKKKLIAENEKLKDEKLESDKKLIEEKTKLIEESDKKIKNIVDEQNKLIKESDKKLQKIVVENTKLDNEKMQNQIKLIAENKKLIEESDKKLQKIVDENTNLIDKIKLIEENSSNLKIQKEEIEKNNKIEKKILMDLNTNLDNDNKTLNEKNSSNLKIQSEEIEEIEIEKNNLKEKNNEMINNNIILINEINELFDSLKLPILLKIKESLIKIDKNVNESEKPFSILDKEINELNSIKKETTLNEENPETLSIDKKLEKINEFIKTLPNLKKGFLNVKDFQEYIIKNYLSILKLQNNMEENIEKENMIIKNYTSNFFLEDKIDTLIFINKHYDKRPKIYKIYLYDYFLFFYENKKHLSITDFINNYEIDSIFIKSKIFYYLYFSNFEKGYLNLMQSNFIILKIFLNLNKKKTINNFQFMNYIIFIFDDNENPDLMITKNDLKTQSILEKLNDNIIKNLNSSLDFIKNLTKIDKIIHYNDLLFSYLIIKEAVLTFNIIFKRMFNKTDLIIKEYGVELGFKNEKDFKDLLNYLILQQI